MSDRPVIRRDDLIAVGIIETDVLGVKAYHARCLRCGWETRRYDRSPTAVRNGRHHICDDLDPNEFEEEAR